MESGIILPLTRRILGADSCACVIERALNPDPDSVEEAVAASTGELPPGWTRESVAGLVQLDLLHRHVMGASVPDPGYVDALSVNPTFDMVRLSWDPTQVIDSVFERPPDRPVAAESWVMGWREPGTGEPRFIEAGPDELLAVKLVVESIDRLAEADSLRIPVARLDGVVRDAVERGILLAPPTRIRRDSFEPAPGVSRRFLESATFTIQWHITNACDLHCLHCYDRTLPSPLSLGDGLRILDDLWRFTWERGVRGHVCLTGGNPFMHPDFTALYRAASERGFYLSILGNPTPRSRVKEIADIQMPEYFQVSLEGLAEHNDHVRGRGHFKRVLGFLDVLRELGISSQVMLTLTSDNIDQVLPLAEVLRGKVDDFTFNRLAQVGEGAALALPESDAYAAFLERYVDAAQDNPAIAWKDNLLNIVRHRRGMGLFGGCTGHGCGAAFNFVAVLPDGEVHACRKFPSPVGRVPEMTLAEVYESAAANRYRGGCEECAACEIRPVCGGCLAVAHGQGLDVFRERDPMCFWK